MGEQRSILHNNGPVNELLKKTKWPTGRNLKRIPNHVCGHVSGVRWRRLLTANAQVELVSDGIRYLGKHDYSVVACSHAVERGLNPALDNGGHFGYQIFSGASVWILRSPNILMKKVL